MWDGMPEFVGVAVALFCLFLISGCASPNGDEIAARWIAEMDAAPPEERIPHYDEVRALMMRPAPEVGAPAPDFELATREGDRTVRLSSFRGERPVVLIFGSWT